MARQIQVRKPAVKRPTDPPPSVWPRTPTANRAGRTWAAAN